MAERTVGLSTELIPDSISLANAISGQEAQALKNSALRQKMSLADLKAMQAQKQFEQLSRLNTLIEQQKRLGLASQLAGAGLQDQALGIAPELEGASLDQLAQVGLTSQQRITNEQQEKRIGLERERLDVSKEQFDRTFEQREREFGKAEERDMRDFLFRVEQADEASKRFFASFQQNQFNSDRDYELNRAKLILESQAAKNPQFSSDVGKIIADMQAAEATGNTEAVDALSSALKTEQRSQAVEVMKEGEKQRYKTLVTNSDASLEQLGTIAEMKELLSRTDTGLQNAVTLPVNKALNAIGAVFGVKLGADISDKEALNALMNKGVLNAAKSLTGPKSDKDIAFLKASVPGLLNTKEGNLILINFMEEMAELQIAQEQYVSDQLNSGESTSVSQALKKWREFNDSSIFSEEERKNIARLRSKKSTSTPQRNTSELSDDDIRNQLGL